MFLLLLCLFALTASDISAQTDRKVKKNLLRLFELCKDGNNRGAAKYIVYRGPDETRKWKDTYNYDSETEKFQVDEVCRRINGYLELDQDYQFGKFQKEKESEGTWNIWEVFFAGEKVYFAFLKINNRYCLGDID